MGARYLLIECDDEAASTRLREQIDNATIKGKKIRVVGLFARPATRTCQCVFTKGERSKDRVARGGRLGWWVCTTCKLPRLGNHNLINLLNIKEILKPARFKGVDAFVADMEPRIYTRYPAELALHTLPGRLAN